MLYIKIKFNIQLKVYSYKDFTCRYNKKTYRSLTKLKFKKQNKKWLLIDSDNHLPFLFTFINILIFL